VINKHLQLVKLVQNLNEVTEAIIFTDFIHSYYCFAMDCENTLNHDEQHCWKRKVFPKASTFNHLLLNKELGYCNISATSLPKI